MSRLDVDNALHTTIVIGSVYPTYGAARVAIDIAESLSIEGGVQVITADGDASRNRNVLAPEIKHVHIARSPGLLGWLVYTRKLRTILQASPSGPIIGFLTLTNIALIISGLGSSYCRRIIVSEHNIQSAALRKFKRKFFAIAIMMRTLYPRAGSVVCVSESVRKDLVEILKVNPANMRVVSNPIDSDRIKRRAEEPLSALDAEFCQRYNIACVAELKSAKQQSLLIDAMVYVNNPTRLLLIGDGADDEKLRKHALDLGIAERVVFLGRRENPWPIVSRIAATVLVPEYEGFGLSAAESAVVGTIPICGSVGGLGEIAMELGAPIVPREGKVDTAAAIACEINDAVANGKKIDHRVLESWLEAHRPAVVSRQYVNH